MLWKHSNVILSLALLLSCLHWLPASAHEEIICTQIHCSEPHPDTLQVYQAKELWKMRRVFSPYVHRVDSKEEPWQKRKYCISKSIFCIFQKQSHFSGLKG